MIDTLTSTPFFGLGVTLLCWYLAVRFQKRTGLLICNPVLVASLLVIGIMLLFHIPLDNYNAGGSIIKLLLAPATAVLALNIYQQRAGEVNVRNRERNGIFSQIFSRKKPTGRNCCFAPPDQFSIF
jgi:putative effector of murein hydrolase